MSKISADDPLVQMGLFGEPMTGPPKQGMRLDFIYPPFSVLNAREGWWQERKREWLSLGIMSEIGRGNANLSMARPATTSTLDFYEQKRRMEAEDGCELTTAEVKARLAALGALTDQRAANASRFADD